MIKDLAKVLISVFVATLVIYPVSSIIADILLILWPVSLMNTIIITLVRYIGFFVGVGVVMYIYRGSQQRTMMYGAENPYIGVR
jgi:hypothetical protein